MSLSWNSIKQMFFGNDHDVYDEDEYTENSGPDYDEPVPQTAPQTNTTSSAFRPAKTGGYNTVAQRPNSMKVVIVEPTVFEDSERITNELRDMRPVVINFEKPTLMNRRALLICERRHLCFRRQIGKNR